MGTLNITRTQLGDYQVTWGSYFFGAVDKVTPNLAIVLAPIRVGSVGATKLGERVVGLDGDITIEAREIDAGFYKALVPWSSSAGSATPGTSGASTSLTPATVHQDLYLNSLALLLHPDHLASGDTSQDLTLLHAVGQTDGLGERDGVKDNVVKVKFTFYPDRESLPILNYGYFGPAPG